MRGWSFLFLIFLAFTGCIYIQVPSPVYAPADSDGARDSFNHSRQLFEKGDYEGAIKGYQYILDSYANDPLVPEAQLGLAYAYLHIENPNRNEEKALKAFQSFIEKYPAHPENFEAKNWVKLLTRLNEQKSEIERLKGDLQKLLTIDIESEKKRKENQ